MKGEDDGSTEGEDETAGFSAEGTGEETEMLGSLPAHPVRIKETKKRMAMARLALEDIFTEDSFLTINDINLKKVYHKASLFPILFSRESGIAGKGKKEYHRENKGRSEEAL